MPSLKLIPAILAIGASFVSAESCSDIDPITDANPSISCTTIKGDVEVKGVAGMMTFEGPQTITGDLKILNASTLEGFSSSSLREIGGSLILQNLEKLNSVSLPALREVEKISFINLHRIGSLSLGTAGLTKAKSITIQDTYLDNLDQFKVSEVDTFDITTNDRLKSFDSSLEKITDSLIINRNGRGNFAVNLDKLTTAGHIEIGSVTDFQVPALVNMSGSLDIIDNNMMKSFSAPNLTVITDDVTIVNNDLLSNVSFAKVTKISSLKIQGNPKMDAIEGFPKLESCAGSINITGKFEKVELPKLEEVQGTVTVDSTADIKDFCKFFDDADFIQGDESCTSKNPKASEAGSTDGSDDDSSDGSSGSGSSDDSDDGAGMLGVSVGVLAIGLTFGFAQIML